MGIRIKGTGRCIPDKILNNDDLERMVDTSDEWIVTRTGIKERHIAEDSQTTSDLAAQAARNALENALLARPRTKEFLAAFPGIMLAVYCAVRRMPFFTALFGLAGTIGMTSICNTFMHIRTPLYLGFVRTGYSLLFGIVVGFALMVGLEILYHLYHRFLKKYVDAELK
jgi:hypothetical protein